MATVLTVLKIIGIILLVVIGLVLLLALAVLFVPVRYRLEASAKKPKDALKPCPYGKPYGEPYDDGSSLADPEDEDKMDFRSSLRASWLLHILSLRISYDKGLQKTVKLFGIPLRKRKKKKTENNKKKKAPKKKGLKKKEERKKQGAPEPGDKTQPLADTEPEGKTEPLAEREPEKKTEPEKEKGSEKEARSEKEAEPEPLDEDKQTLFERLEEFFTKLFDLIENLEERLEALFDKLESICEDISFYVDFLEDEENQEKLERIIEDILRLICHIKPKKLEMSITAGAEDPADTGRILAALSILYPFFPGKLMVTPCFDRSIIDVELKGRGRATVFMLLLIAYRIYYHDGLKDLRRTLKKKR